MTKKSKEKYPDTQRVLTVMTVVEKSGNVNAPVNKYIHKNCERDIEVL